MVSVGRTGAVLLAWLAVGVSCTKASKDSAMSPPPVVTAGAAATVGANGCQVGDLIVWPGEPCLRQDAEAAVGPPMIVHVQESPSLILGFRHAQESWDSVSVTCREGLMDAVVLRRPDHVVCATEVEALLDPALGLGWEEAFSGAFGRPPAKPLNKGLLGERSSSGVRMQLFLVPGAAGRLEPAIRITPASDPDAVPVARAQSTIGL